MTEPEDHDKTMFIRCKCGEEVQVAKGCEVEWQICKKCARMGCYEIIKFD